MLGKMKVTSLNKKAQKTQCSPFALTLPALSLPLSHIKYGVLASRQHWTKGVEESEKKTGISVQCSKAKEIEMSNDEDSRQSSIVSFNISRCLIFNLRTL